MKKEREAIYLGEHKIEYRAIRGNERGVLYKKRDIEIFLPCALFIQDLLSGPYIQIETQK